MSKKKVLFEAIHDALGYSPGGFHQSGVFYVSYTNFRVPEDEDTWKNIVSEYGYQPIVKYFNGVE